MKLKVLKVNVTESTPVTLYEEKVTYCAGLVEKVKKKHRANSTNLPVR